MVYLFIFSFFSTFSCFFSSCHPVSSLWFYKFFYLFNQFKFCYLKNQFQIVLFSQVLGAHPPV